MKGTLITLILVSCLFSTASAFIYEYKPTPTMPPPAIDADSTHNWDAIHYNLQLQVTPVSVPNNLFIDGQVEIQFTPEITGLDTVDLHLHGLNVSSVQLDGVDCNYTREGDILYVELPEPHNPGEDLYLVIMYSGTPEITNLITPTGIFHPSSNMIYTMNDPFGARNWIPCWDEPWDKATINLQLTLPSEFIVVANGTFQDSTVIGDWIQWTYDMNEPITTYLISFCASDYATFEQTAGSVAIKHFVYPHHLTAAQYDFERVPEMITALSDYFGPYPFDTYGYAEAPIFGGGGAMEHQTIVTFGSLLITGTRTYEWIVVHELGHMWFGDAVSYIDWPEMWLSEGFAVYSEALWHQHLGGMPGYFQHMTQQQQTYFGWENLINPVPIYDPPWNMIWSPLTYEKPASVLHMLRYHLGDQVFFGFLQTYVATFLHGNASTNDVKDVVEQVSGDNYDWFFDQWIYHAGYPIYEYFGYWEPLTDDHLVTLSVAQLQNESMPRFQTDADLYVFSGGDTLIQRITVQALEAQTIEFTVADEPDSIQLDPRSWILCQKYRRDDLTEPILSAENVVIDDEGGSGFLDPGETGELHFTLLNIGLPVPAMTLELTSFDPLLTVLEGLRNAPGLSFNGQYGLSENPFIVENAQSSGPRWSDFQLQINDSLSGNPIATIDFSFPIGTPELLLVDDDGGGSSEVNHQLALNEIRRVYQTVEYTSVGELPDLVDYYGVIWLCGYETSNTLTAEDQTLLEDYLLSDNGALMVSGRGIVPDLAGTDFFENVLHARDAGTTTIIVMDGIDPLIQDLSFFIAGDGANQDILGNDGTAGSGDLLAYSGISTASALKYDGDYKSVVFGFGFEDIQPENSIFSGPSDLMGPLMAWFTGTPAVKDEGQFHLPQTFRVGKSYPNPFNAETVIPFELPQKSKVYIDLFNVQGQRLGRIYEGIENAGWRKVHYNASNLPSGVYFYRVIAEEINGKILQGVGKMLLLK